MHVEYPYTITQDEEGYWLARCPDVRGAATDDPDRAAAVAELRDALEAALEAYAESCLPLPTPSAPVVHGQTIIATVGDYARAHDGALPPGLDKAIGRASRTAYERLRKGEP